MKRELFLYMRFGGLFVVFYAAYFMYKLINDSVLYQITQVIGLSVIVISYILQEMSIRRPSCKKKNIRRKFHLLFLFFTGLVLIYQFTDLITTGETYFFKSLLFGIVSTPCFMKLCSYDRRNL